MLMMDVVKTVVGGVKTMSVVNVVVIMSVVETESDVMMTWIAVTGVEDCLHLDCLLLQ